MTESPWSLTARLMWIGIWSGDRKAALSGCHGRAKGRFMLKHLKQADIDAVIAACGAPAAPGASADAEAGASPRQHGLYELIESLSMDAQDELLALMWTGGPTNQSSFEENLELV